MNVGFIGLGVMGSPMAAHLLRAGHILRTKTRRSPVPSALLDSGMMTCSSPAEVAAESMILITMLPDTADVETVLFAPGGAADGLREGSIFLDMSTISPDATRKFAERLQARGVEYVDAPESGGEVGARNGDLTNMFGGSDEAADATMPLLKLLGKRITHIGEVGTGQICKLTNQVVVGGTIQAIAEALVLAAKAGADPARVREALLAGFAHSRVLEVHGARMIERNFAPGFRLQLHRKDLELALTQVRVLSVALPTTAQVAQLMTACAASDGADLDHSSLIRATESISQHQIASSVQQ